MTRTLLPVALVLAFSATAAAQQPPSVQNGRLETRSATSIDREVTSFSASADPVWIGWSVPIVDGERVSGCQNWISDSEYWRGTQLDFGVYGATTTTNRPQTAPATAAALEAPSTLVVLARISEGRVERLRSIGADCPIDAGGRSLYWLNGVTPAESLRWLDTFTTLDKGDRLSMTARKDLANTAVGTIARHRDAAADVILDRIATKDLDASLRQQAQSSLGTLRGAHGFATLRTLLATERTQENRRRLVTAIGATREPGTVDVLRGLLKDSDDNVRGEAVYYFAIRGGQKVVPEVRAVMDSDPVANVRTRAVSGLARLPEDAAVPLLIDIVGTSKDPEVRKKAVSSLGTSKDPRAVQFLQDLVKK